jgi:hypothetical protein
LFLSEYNVQLQRLLTTFFRAADVDEAKFLEIATAERRLQHYALRPGQSVSEVTINVPGDV